MMYRAEDPYCRMIDVTCRDGGTGPRGPAGPVAHVHVVHHRSYSDTGDDDEGRETTIEQAGPVQYQVWNPSRLSACIEQQNHKISYP